MYPESDFYQISGYRAHSNGWFKMYDDKPMMDAIISTKSKLFRPGGQDAPVELILGILPSGASYLLMSSEQMLEFTRKHRLRIPRDSWRANDFLSLSPVYFNSLGELSAKIATYKQRPRNKNRREQEEPLDNSQANRGYVKTGSDVVHYRAYFEQQRTLYRLLMRQLDPGKVGLVPPPWLSCVRVLSLVLEEWSVDNRIRSDRLKVPKLVNVGWTDALLPSFFQQLTGTAVHLKVITTLKMNNAASKKPYFSEVTEDDQAGLNARLRNLFCHDANKSGIPLVVLVHDEEMARGVLSRAGIDLGSWSSGLSDLLPFAPVKNRRVKIEEDKTSNLPRACIVDTQKLVKALMETSPGHTVQHSAKVLRMQTDIKTCAGDDSLLQLRVWMSMAQELTIDEQRKQRASHQPICTQLLGPPQEAVQANAEVDPNNLDPNDADPNDMPPRQQPTIANDFSDDDDDW